MKGQRAIEGIIGGDLVDDLGLQRDQVDAIRRAGHEVPILDGVDLQGQDLQDLGILHGPQIEKKLGVQRVVPRGLPVPGAGGTNFMRLRHQVQVVDLRSSSVTDVGRFRHGRVREETHLLDVDLEGVTSILVACDLHAVQ